MLRKYGIVIFVHGCFWHGHEIDGTIPKTNHEFWKNKIEKNKQRDERNKNELQKLGWSVITVWECQLKPATRQQTLLEIEYHINHTYLNKYRSLKTKPYTTQESPLSIAAENIVKYRK